MLKNHSVKQQSGQPIKSLLNDGADVDGVRPIASLSINGVEEPLCEAAKLSGSCLRLFLESNVVSTQVLNVRLQLGTVAALLRQKQRTVTWTGTVNKGQQSRERSSDLELLTRVSKAEKGKREPAPYATGKMMLKCYGIKAALFYTSPSHATRFYLCASTVRHHQSCQMMYISTLNPNASTTHHNQGQQLCPPSQPQPPSQLSPQTTVIITTTATNHHNCVCQ